MAQFKTSYSVTATTVATQTILPTGILASGSGARGWNIKAFEISSAEVVDPAKTLTGAGPAGYSCALSSVNLGSSSVPNKSNASVFFRFDYNAMTTAAGVIIAPEELPRFIIPQEDELLVASENIFWVSLVENMATRNFILTIHWDSVALSELDILRIRSA